MLFAATAQQARDEAIARVEANAEPNWLLAALRVVYDLCAYRESFTTDDVWAKLEAQGVEPAHEPRALGAVMVKARNRGWCRPSGMWVQSVRRACHSRPIMTWRTARVLPDWDRLT